VPTWDVVKEKKKRKRAVHTEEEYEVVPITEIPESPGEGEEHEVIPLPCKHDILNLPL
jgi:hypothetical protein